MLIHVFLITVEVLKQNKPFEMEFKKLIYIFNLKCVDDLVCDFQLSEFKDVYNISSDMIRFKKYMVAHVSVIRLVM